MVDEISCLAKSKNKKAKSVFTALLVTSAIVTFIANFTDKYSGIIWVFALAFITATIYVYNRYVGSEYCYTINNEGGRPSFVVSMKVGRTARTVARVDLDSIVEIRRMSGDEFRTYKCDKGIMKYPYFPTMFTDEVYLVAIRSEYENSDVFIEADTEFISALESYTVS